MLRVNAINRQGLLKCLTFNPKSLVFKTVSVPDLVEKQLIQMTLREKVGQMFYVRLESLDPTLTRAFAAF